MTTSIDTESPEETMTAAAKLASLLHGGEVIELRSDLGGGKTTFVQGLAKALGYDGEVTSPTFTLSRVYRLPRDLELHHYDLYRLGQSGVVGDELAEDINEPAYITVIEWAGIIADELPKDHLVITFNVTGDTARRLEITSGGKTSDHIVEGLIK